jgi:DNA-binding CsgD family transcriptional regulator
MTTRLENVGVSQISEVKTRGSPCNPAQGTATESIQFHLGNRMCWAIRAGNSEMTDSTSKQQLAAENGPRYPCGWLRLRDQTYVILVQPDREDGAGDYRSAKDEPLESLTQRETQIAVLVSRGKGTKQIAGRLRISEHTVRSYMRRIFSKLRVSTRPAMVAQLLKSGIGLANLVGEAGEKGDER